MIAETVLWPTVTPRAKRSSAVTLRLTIGATGGLVDLADLVLLTTCGEAPSVRLADPVQA